MTEKSPSEETARQRIATLEREARALGTDLSAAVLFHEIGQLYETPLNQPLQAVIAYQAAYRIAPKFVSNIRAARRLLSETGHWNNVVDLIDAEMAAGPSANRPPLLFEKGKILLAHLSQEELANKCFNECLRSSPKDLSLLVQMESTFARRGQYSLLVQVYRLLSDATTDSSARAGYLYAAGSTLENQLNQFSDAADAYRSAFAIDRTDPAIVAAMKRVAEKEGRPDEVLNALIAEATILGADAGPTFLRISQIYERIARPDDAIAALSAARENAPSDKLILSELARLLEINEREDELSDVLLSLASVAEDDSTFVATQLRLASLFELRSGQQQYAIAHYQTVLSRIPGHPTALAALGKLYHQQEDWVGLLAAYDAEINALQDVRQKLSRMYKAGEVLELNLGRVEQAIARYRQCLEWAPGYLPAQKALARLFEREGRFQELAEMLENDLKDIEERDLLIAALSRLASLYENHLKDKSRAADCLRRILDLAPEHAATMQSLARILEETGNWRELISLNEKVAALTKDLKHVVFLLHRNAEILDEKLRDLTGATAAFERVLAISPSYVPALQALGRLYFSEGRWEDLIRMHRTEADSAPSAEFAASLVQKIGEICETHLKDTHRATEAYQEVLRLSPDRFPATHALIRIYRSSKNWEPLLELLNREAIRRTEPEAKASAYYQMAHILENELRLPVRAVEIYQDVLKLWPQHAASRDALKRLFVLQNNEEETENALKVDAECNAAPHRIAASVRLAELSLKQGRPEEANRLLTEANHRDPLSFSVLRLMSALPDVEPLTNSRSALAQCVSDFKLQAAFLSSQEAVSDGTDNLPSKIETYVQRANLARDMTEKGTLWLKAGRLYEEGLADDSKASEAYNKALEVLPRLLPALQGRLRIFERLGQWQQAKELALAIATSARDTQCAAEAYVAAGKAALKINEHQQASTYFGRALEHQNQFEPALQALKSLSSADNGGSAAEAIPALASTDVEAEAEPILLSPKEVLKPEVPASDLSELLDKAVSAQEWKDAADILEKMIHQETAGLNQAFLLLQLARIQFEELQNEKFASHFAKQAVALAKTDAVALESAATLFAQMKKPQEFVRATEAVVASTTNAEESFRLQVTLAGIQSDILGQPDLAILTLRKLTMLRPDAIEPHIRLAEIYSQFPNAASLCIESHRSILRLDIGRTDSLHALFSIWKQNQQWDRAFCVAGILQFFKQASEEETQFYSALLAKAALTAQPSPGAIDIETLLHPQARTPLVAVLRAIGDAFSKIMTIDFDRIGVDRKRNAYKPGHPLHEAILSVASLFGVNVFEAYEASRGYVEVEPTTPFAVCINRELPDTLNLREFQFLLGRAAFSMAIKSPILKRMPTSELEDTVGNAIRAVLPAFEGLGKRDEKATTRLKKAFSKEALKQLELAASGFKGPLAFDAAVEALRTYSEDRAGLLVAQDVSAGLSIRLKMDPRLSLRATHSDSVVMAAKQSRELQELILFALSDDFFKLRQKWGISLSA